MNRIFLLLMTFFLFCGLRTFAGEGGFFTWQGDDATNPDRWDVNANWDLLFPPGDQDQAYFFETASTFDVNLVDTQKMGRLSIGGAQAYTFGPPGSVMLLGSQGDIDASISDPGLTHIFNCGVRGDDGNLSIQGISGSLLVFNAPVENVNPLNNIYGDVLLNAANQFPGGRFLGRNLILGHSGALGSGPLTTDFNTQKTLVYLNGVVIPNAIELENNDSGNITLNITSGTAEQNGVISGSDVVNKSGAGTLILGGANTYLGNTFVQGGTLLANNDGSVSATGSGQVTVSTGAALGGSGKVGVSVIVQGGAELVPGLSPGILSMESLALNPGVSGAVTRVELAGTMPGTGYDQIVVTNTAQLGGSLVITETNGFQSSGGDRFTILTAGNVVGTFNDVSFPAGRTNWVINYTPTSVVVSLGAPTPMLHWDLEEGSGLFTRELVSGKTNVAHLVGGPIWTNGIAPGSTSAVYFEDTLPGSYIDAGTLNSSGVYEPDIEAANGTILSSAWTIAAWIQIPDDAQLTSGDRCIITSALTGNQNWWLFLLRDTVQNLAVFDFRNVRKTSALQVPVGRPALLAISSEQVPGSFSTTNRTRFALWSGGQWSTEEAMNNSSIRLDGLEIGSFNGGTREWIGTIDDLRIYDEVLTQTELDRLAIANAIDGDLGAYIQVLNNQVTPTGVIFQVSFSEPVQAFDAADLVISGSVTTGPPGITGSGDTYTVVLPIFDEGTLSLDLMPGAGVQTLDGNPLVITTPITLEIDYSGPQVSSFVLLTNRFDELEFRIEFTEPVILPPGGKSGVDMFDITPLAGSQFESFSRRGPESDEGNPAVAFAGFQYIVADGSTGGVFQVAISSSNQVTDLFGNDIDITGSPTLQFVVSASPYQLWAIDKGLTPGVNFDLSDNPDGDRRDNAWEHFRDGNPLVADDPIKQAVWVLNRGGTNYVAITVPVPDYAEINDVGESQLYFDGCLWDECIYDYFTASEALSDLENGDYELFEDSTIPNGLPPLSPGYSYRTIYGGPVDGKIQSFIATDTYED